MRVIGDGPRSFEPRSKEEDKSRSFVNPSPNYLLCCNKSLRGRLILPERLGNGLSGTGGLLGVSLFS
ncbi:hypothetical protein TNCV_5088391 [Trichonephila clavipes]|nr:hypothetical protein TNCV_5088391 [Trichonephila clavipes]